MKPTIVLKGGITLYHADCFDVIPDITFDSLVTDPPYGMNFQSNHRIEKHQRIKGDDNNDALHSIIMGTRCLTTHSSYIFARWDNLYNLPKPTSLITWVKNNWSMGDLDHEHARQTECILFYPGPNHTWPAGRPTDVVHARRSGNIHHPTEKPVELMEQIVEWTEGTVYDPFMGSGSTGIACARLGRPFIGVESDPLHFNTAVKRIMQEHNQGKLF